MGQVGGPVGGRLNVLANIICQWGKWRYLKWFGPVGLHSVEIRNKALFCFCIAVSNFVRFCYVNKILCVLIFCLCALSEEQNKKLSLFL